MTSANIADQHASKIEAAVKGNDSAGFDQAMKEVDKYYATHTPGENKDYTQSLTKKLQDDKILPRVALFEAGKKFQNIDVNEDGKLEGWEMKNFKNQSGVNPLDKELADVLKKKMDDNKLAGLDKSMISEQLKQEQNKAENRASLDNLFRKDTNGVSLYDKLKDANGNVPGGAIARMQELGDAAGLSPADRRTLQFLQSARSLNQSLNPASDDLKREDIEKLCQQYEVSKSGISEYGAERSTLAHFFDKGASGKSLYDRLKDSSGNIGPGAIRKMLALDASNPQALNLSDEDRKTLKYLGEKRSLNQSWNPLADDLKKEDLQALCNKSGLDFKQMEKGETPQKIARDKAKTEADAKAKAEADAKAKAEADAKAKAEADAKAKAEADAKTKTEADAKAKAEADAKAKAEADAKAKAEADAKEREEFRQGVLEKLKNESTLPALKKGEGYFQVLKRVHPDWTPAELSKEARRIKYQVNGGRSELKVGEQVRTMTKEDEEKAIASALRQYDKNRVNKL